MTNNSQWSLGLLKNHPKVAAKLKLRAKDALGQMQQAAVEANDSLSPIDDDLLDLYLPIQIGSNPYALTDFFDEHHLYLTLNYTHDGGFIPIIIGTDYNSKGYTSRREAEKAGIEELFKILENE